MGKNYFMIYWNVWMSFILVLNLRMNTLNSKSISWMLLWEKKGISLSQTCTVKQLIVTNISTIILVIQITWKSQAFTVKDSE